MSRKSQYIVFIIAVLFILPVASCSASSSLKGRTIYVDCTNTEGPWDGTAEHPYQFIVDGVNHAENGDTVYVRTGHYTEHVVIEKTISLSGEGPNETCMSNVDRNSTCITLLASYATIENITFIGNGGYIPAIRLLSATGNTITQNVIRDFYTGISLEDAQHNDVVSNILSNISGTGIGLYQAVSSYIHANYIDAKESGIDLASSNSNIITSNTLQGHKNTVDFSYGIRIALSNDNTIGANDFIEHNLGVSFEYVSHSNTVVNNDFTGDLIGGIFAYGCFLNYWNGNYWNRPHILPRPIFGWILNVPVVKFDWHPARAPNT